MQEFLVNWLASVPEFAVPFALAALGLIISEKSGVLNLGAEGFMLIGAATGAGAFITLGGYPLIALVLAAVVSMIFALIFAILVIGLRINQVISGLLMVILAQGLTSLVATQQSWTNIAIEGLGKIDLGPLTTLPILGPILFHQDLIVYLLIPIFAGVTYVLNRTFIGLRLRAVGENPEAADAAGINVGLYRLGAVMVGAALIGLAGGYLTVVVAKIWVDNMAGGRGWIAVALVIFARWYPWRALAGAVLFGAIDALIPRVAAAGIQVPQYFMLMLPYVVTLGVMVWTSLAKDRTSNEPEALGQPYVREERR